MCGIGGLVEAPGAVVDVGALRRMAGAIAHRGPDGEGFWRGPGSLAHTGLVHRRLSILDHAGGRQPMVDGDDDKGALVFNGQIYNHVVLRRDLESRGVRFRSDHSDTESLLRGLMDQGSAVCARLSGMFAFAFVDVDAGRLIMARDPMGKKPLTIAGPRFFNGRPRLAFASEVAALDVLDGRAGDVDENAAARFFAFDFVPDPDSIWRGAWKLPPGHVVEVDLRRPDTWDTLRSRPYRPQRFGSQPLRSTFVERAADLRAVVDDAVKDRLLHADVPVGVFLSGGIDSSLVAALAARHTDRLETFSIGFREPSFDESAWARLVARHIGSRHHEQILDERALLDLLPQVGAHLSEPFADHSVVPTMLLARFARERVTVALGGDGGDELFLGYPTFAAERVAGPLSSVGALGFVSSLTSRLAQLSDLLPVSHSDLALDEKVRRTVDGLAERRPLRRHQRFLTGATSGRLHALFAPDVRRRLDADLLTNLDRIEDEANENGARDVFDVVTWGYLRTYLAAGVLQKVDRATMAVSLEARAPLLDRRVVDFALSLPVDDKLGSGGKRILKAAARGLVPDAILDRRKKGFGMPVAAWLNGPLRPLVDELLSPAAVRADGFLDVDVVTGLVREHRHRVRNHRKILWALLMWMLWRRRSRR